MDDVGSDGRSVGCGQTRMDNNRHSDVGDGGVRHATSATSGRVWTTLDTWLTDVAKGWLSEENVELSQHETGSA